MCFKDGNREESSDPAPRPSRGGAYHGRLPRGRQHVGQNQRDRHEEQHDTPKSSNAPLPPPPPVPTAPSSGGGQHVGQNQRGRHEEQHDTPKSSNAPLPPPPPVPTAPMPPAPVSVASMPPAPVSVASMPPPPVSVASVPPPPVSVASMPPQAPPLPPSRRKPSSERSISPSRITEFYPGPAASPSAVIINPASDAISRNLRHSKIHWAVVGGACCVLLGSTRETSDIDMVVSKPEYVRQVKNLLKADHRFTVDPRTRQTFFHQPGHDPLEIQVLCFPSTFRIAFDSETEVLDVNGVHLLTFAAILNSKCGCLPERSSEAKRVSDTQDIVFILLLAIDRGMRFDRNEVPNATEDFQNALERYREGVKQYFQAVGL